MITLKPLIRTIPILLVWIFATSCFKKSDDTYNKYLIDNIKWCNEIISNGRESNYYSGQNTDSLIAQYSKEKVLLRFEPKQDSVLIEKFNFAKKKFLEETIVTRKLFWLNEALMTRVLDMSQHQHSFGPVVKSSQWDIDLGDTFKCEVLYVLSLDSTDKFFMYPTDSDSSEIKTLTRNSPYSFKYEYPLKQKGTNKFTGFGSKVLGHDTVDFHIEATPTAR